MRLQPCLCKICTWAREKALEDEAAKVVTVVNTETRLLVPEGTKGESEVVVRGYGADECPQLHL